MMSLYGLFPSPPEVDRFISEMKFNFKDVVGFPSSHEVDSFYPTYFPSIDTNELDCYRPLPRYIGLYHTCMRLCQLLKMLCFRPLARYIGLYL